MSTYLYGKIISPIITKHPKLRIFGNPARILYPRRKMIGKLTASVKAYPFGYIGYTGTLEVVIKKEKTLSQILNMDQFGLKVTEGYEEVEWLYTTTKQEEYKQKKKKYNRVKIRKGIPLKLNSKEQALIQYALLHDCVHTEKHRSKIYVEIPLEDKILMERLHKHHQKIPKDSLIQQFQIFDRWAADLTRKVVSPAPSRYNWKSKKHINFNKLAKEIAIKAANIWELYKYIYDSKELGYITEDMTYGHNSLKLHLLLVTNLIINNILSRTGRKAVKT